MAERENNLENIEKQKTKKSSKRKNSLGRELLEDVVLVIVVLAVVFFLKNYVLINAVIPSGSMENTIMTGDRVIGSRLSYKFGDPERGDIVIFRFPDNEEIYYVKRVIGLPGDTIDIVDGHVYLNGSETPLDLSLIHI